MNHYDYLMDHDSELFELLCWIYYPVITAVDIKGVSYINGRRFHQDDFEAARTYSDDEWSFFHRGLPAVTGHMRFIDYTMNTTEIDFRIKLPSMHYTKLVGTMTNMKASVPQLVGEAFHIVDRRFVFCAEGSKLPNDENTNPEKNWAFISEKDYPKASRDFKRITASTDKIFYEWLDEIQHLSTLAKISL